MDVTLIRPPAYSTGLMGAQLVPYLGIAYIAASARQAGHNVDIVDMCAEDIDRTEIVDSKFISYGMPFLALKKRLKPSAVFGFTSMFSQDWVFHRRLIRYVADLFPESTIIAGGEHISALPQYCLKDCPQLDICIVGEADDVFVKLLAKIEKKENFADVPSLVYRNRDDGSLCVTERAERIKDINRLPRPAWDLMPLENYLSRGFNYHIMRGRTIPMLASRGCPYNCTFCSNSNMWGAPWVAREAKLVVDEMEHYITHYKADNFVFSDLTAVVNRRDIIGLCQEIISRKLRITWQLPTLRTEAVNEDVLRLMYQAGCRELDFAIESGSRDVLISVKKRNDPRKMAGLISKALKSGMNLSANVVLGLPQEGIKEFFRTYWLALKLAVSGMQEINAFPFVPYPGSHLFREFIRSKRLNLEDAYFLSLFGYANLTQAISWSEKFSPRMLCFLRLFLLISFYGLMFITHPLRIIRLFVKGPNAGASRTKLEGVLGRIRRNLRAYSRTEDLSLCKKE